LQRRGYTGKWERGEYGGNRIRKRKEPIGKQNRKQKGGGERREKKNNRFHK